MRRGVLTVMYAMLRNTALQGLSPEQQDLIRSDASTAVHAYLYALRVHSEAIWGISRSVRVRLRPRPRLRYP